MLGAFSYVLTQALERVRAFAVHWYIDSFFFISRSALNLLEALDQRIAVKVSLRNLFVPLYQDKTVSGYLFGFLFRLIRGFSGLILYIFIALVAAGLYLGWAGIPLLILAWGFDFQLYG
ncbi:MAG: hypothetical protein Q8P45_01720 [Candidatus Harrisonbacteria bacterium]|nr:hypothetical protein [Candidatus Harrisonbacteria bacterium]